MLESIRTKCENENWFEVKTGMKQSNFLWELLYKTYLDRVIVRVKDDFGYFDGDEMANAVDLVC